MKWKFLECGHGAFNRLLVIGEDIEFHKLNGFQQAVEQIGTHEIVEGDTVARILQLPQALQQTLIRLNILQQFEDDTLSRQRFAVIGHDEISAKIDERQVLSNYLFKPNVHEGVQDHLSRGLIAVRK